MAISLRLAKEHDLPAIVTLMNAAFRGNGVERSWSTEAAYITGDRTSAFLLRAEWAEGARFLLSENEERSGLRGCVSLKALSPERWYLGSLTVDPALQNAGFGRELLSAAEEYATKQGALAIEITVVNVRDTLISWYEHRGYRTTGETRPFPYDDHRFGTPMRGDLNFIVLEKHLRE